MKTANELASEYWNKPPIDRVGSTIQDYIFDHQQEIIDNLKKHIKMSIISIQDGEVDYAEKRLKRALK